MECLIMYDKQGEKKRKRGVTNALNVKEDCGLCQTWYAKTCCCMGAVHVRKKQCCQHNYRNCVKSVNEPLYEHLWGTMFWPLYRGGLCWAVSVLIIEPASVRIPSFITPIYYQFFCIYIVSRKRIIFYTGSIITRGCFVHKLFICMGPGCLAVI